MISRQLFEPISSTYLIGCAQTGQAALIDPALPTWQRDFAEVSRLGLKLTLRAGTHIHADHHITAARNLKQEVSSRIAPPAFDGLVCVDAPLEEGKPLELGSVVLEPIFTPGHTNGRHAYCAGERVLTGDALLIDGCARTDLHCGDARALYHSARERLFALPEDARVYPVHNYKGRATASAASAPDGLQQYCAQIGESVQG